MQSKSHTNRIARGSAWLPLGLLVATCHADPQLNSWLTESTGCYARIYETDADQFADNAVTTWVHPAGGAGQAQPTYAGVHEISTTDTTLYVRATGLGFHVMGPWYTNDTRTQIFQNYPANIAEIFHFPRNPVIPTSKTILNGLAVGCFVDGVTMFDTRDLFSYSNARGFDSPPFGGNPGDSIWNRNAALAEGATFDPSNGHQANDTYHMHISPQGLRHQLGDSMDRDPATNTYTENFNGQHSPIIGWVGDGLPIYGPYGYSDPLDPNSGVRRMVTGFQVRDGSNGSSNLAATGRTSLPLWRVRNDPAYDSPALAASQIGPDVSAGFPLERYLEDNAYKGDLGFELGVDFDLNEYNTRWCVTPEFPGGTWAYFTCIEADGTPTFPYNLNLYYFGTAPPVMGRGSPIVVNAIPGDATIHFEGGPEKSISNDRFEVDEASGDVTLVWNAVEGGTYRIESTEDLNTWEPRDNVVADSEKLVVEDDGVANVDLRGFYRVSMVGLADFDDQGFVYDEPAEPTGGNNILFILIDDWGIDSSPIDNPGAASNPSMPTLAALAAQGLRFTQAYSQPTCSPTRASLLTGRYVFRHGVGTPTAPQLPAAEFALPEAFSAAGSPYGMAAFGKWHLGGGLNGPAQVGFPEFSTILGELPDYFNWNASVNGTRTAQAGTYATTVQVDDATSFIQGQGANPWFCWLAFSAPHEPFHEPPSELLPSNPTGTTDRALYEKALEAMDTEIARLLLSVDLATTNVIVMGDNGTPRDTVQPPFSVNHAKASLYEGGSRVPMFAIGPDVQATGTNDDLVHCVDIYATVLALAGIDIDSVVPAGTDIDSRNLVPALMGTGAIAGGVVVETFGQGIGNPGRAIREGDYKLIIFDDPEDANDTAAFEFYNVIDDPDEQSNLLSGPLDANQQAVYQLLLDMNAELGGGFGGA